LQESSGLQHCTVCGGTLAPHLPRVRDPLTKEAFSVVRCTRCRLGHTIPQPENLGSYYASQYYGNRHSFTLRRCLKRRLAFVKSAIRPGKDKRLLDIGCGDGSFLLAAKETGWKVAGTELNSKPAQDSGLDVVEGIEEIPIEAQFECITMWHTLEHMRDIKLTLTRIRELLRPGGKLLIAVPNNGGFQAKIFGDRWVHIDVPRHLYHFDALSLGYCLESSGYTIHRLWHQEFEYDLLGWSQSALNCIMPHQNIFFDCLTGKQKKHSKSATVLSFVLGSALTILALPALAAGTLLRRGGTLVVAAGRTKDAHGG
jgi:SAM-dependent methyltransferase